MKQLISFVIFTSLFYSSFGMAAKEVVKVSSKTKISKSQKSKEASSKEKWNKVCQDLLDSSVTSTLKLEKSVSKKKKVSKKEFDEKIHNELLVVQLNAWVCALSVNEQKGVAAEELFLKDYSKLVQTRKL